MLRITPSTSANGAKEYFTQSLTRSDYYIDGQEIVGEWGGKTAERLGLAGQVDAQSYFSLCDNLHPETGKRLTPRTREARRVGYDFTFSAPKSVSLLYELSGDENILTAFRTSVRETMEEMEREMKTRVRSNGDNEDRLTGNMVWAEFVHFTSRPVEGVADPHLHAHCYAFNTTWDEKEKRFKAGQFGDLKRDATYFEAAFDARLSHRLELLGYATEKDKKYSFEVAGVPEELITKFSERRNQIEKKAAEKGIESPEGKHGIGYYGREHKKSEISKAELRREWNERLTPEERALMASVIHENRGTGRTISAEEAITYAIDHVFERASTISEKRLKAEALKHGVGSVLPEDVAGMGQRQGMILRESKGQLMATTEQVLCEEIAMLQFARDGQRRFEPFVPERELSGKKHENTTEYSRSGIVARTLDQLSDEQRKAALQVLKSRDQVVGIRGGAGTGKTRTLQAIKKGIEASGDLHVYAFAPSAQASRTVLRSEGFNDAETLKLLLVNEKLQEQIRGQVLLIDEAGLTGTKQLREVFALAKRQNARVIAVGDYHQHASVERGDAFRLLEKEAGVRFAELKEIRRQREPAYRKAVEAVARGTGKAAQDGFDKLDRMGSIIEATGEERHSLLVADYLNAKEDGKSALVIAPSHTEGEALSDEIRRAMKERGMIGREKGFTVRKSTGWTDAQKGDARNYEAGMIVEFHQNVAGSRIQKNGKRERIGAFTRGEKAVVTGVKNGQVRVLRQDGSESLLPANTDRFQVFKTREIAIGKGDRIRITKNAEAKVHGQAKGTRLNNGDIYTVEGFTKEGDIKIGGGKLLPKDHGHFTLGYVDTSYASQGKTVERVFIAAGSESFRASSQQQWYVSVSRGQEAVKVYTDSKADLRRTIAKGGPRLSAVELTHTRIRDSWRTQFYKSFERSRISRFIRKRADSIADYFKDKSKTRGLSYG